MVYFVFDNEKFDCLKYRNILDELGSSQFLRNVFASCNKLKFDIKQCRQFQNWKWKRWKMCGLYPKWRIESCSYFPISRLELVESFVLSLQMATLQLPLPADFGRPCITLHGGRTSGTNATSTRPAVTHSGCSPRLDPRPGECALRLNK
jgi:hypothetical protein